MLIYAFLNGVEIHWVRISTLFGNDQHLAYINTFIADPKLPDEWDRFVKKGCQGFNHGWGLKKDNIVVSSIVNLL